MRKEIFVPLWHQRCDCFDTFASTSTAVWTSWLPRRIVSDASSSMKCTREMSLAQPPLVWNNMVLLCAKSIPRYLNRQVLLSIFSFLVSFISVWAPTQLSLNMTAQLVTGTEMTQSFQIRGVHRLFAASFEGSYVEWPHATSQGRHITAKSPVKVFHIGFKPQKKDHFLQSFQAKHLKR